MLTALGGGMRKVDNWDQLDLFGRSEISVNKKKSGTVSFNGSYF